MTAVEQAEPLTPADPAPCQCHRSFAAVLPTHAGHCCFWGSDATCHPAEVANWFRASLRRRGMDDRTPNQLRKRRAELGLSHAEIDAMERDLAAAERAAWPGE